MKRIIFALAILASAVFVAAASADSPFPGQSTNGVFVSAQTVTATNQVSDYFAPGDTVTFRGYAIQTQVKKILTSIAKKKPTNAKTAKTSLQYFFVRIPLADDIPLKYTASAGNGVNGLYRWTATWTVPALYPMGVVHFQVLAKTWSGANGSFAQLPVAPSQLTITSTPAAQFGGPPAISGAYSANLDVALYADAVNGSPAAPGRQGGCTQTNVFKIGETIVPRAYGYNLADGKVLSFPDNVSDAHFSVPGIADQPLNWGQHGATGQKVSYWTGAWKVPVDYPIGDISIHIYFKTLAGKTGTIDYPITIIPAS
jgi:hypothetical protein